VRLTPVAMLLAALLAAACAVPIARAGWQDASGAELRELTLSAPPGGQASAVLQFYPADNESTGLGVQVGGDSAGWVSVTPRRITKVDAGVAVPVTVSAAIPSGAARGSYEASVSLLTGAKTVTKLPIKIVVQ